MDNQELEQEEYTESQSDAGLESVPSSTKTSLPNVPSKKWNRYETLINHNDLYYDMTKTKIAIVFNHIFCDGYKKREGTNNDVHRLENSFKKLNFKVFVYDDLKLKEIKYYMEKVANLDSSKLSCLAVIVLTHGESGKLMAKNKKYSTSCLWDELIGKFPGIPKLFFIQACRGGKVDMGMEVTDAIIDTDLESSYTIPTTADFLKIYSTVDGYKAWKEKDGSWFIQTLCNVLDDLAGRYDLLRLLTLVCRAVAYNFEANTSNNENRSKEMPQIESTLTKFLKFQQIDISEKEKPIKN